jgi:hypothetical protein
MSNDIYWNLKQSMADIHTTSKLPDLELQVLSELVREPRGPSAAKGNQS